LSPGIERRHQEIGPFVLDQLHHVPHETVNRADRLPRRPAHLRQGVEDLVDEGVGIDEVDLFAGQGGSGIRRRLGDWTRRRQRVGGRGICLLKSDERTLANRSGHAERFHRPVDGAVSW
jgi:hypothetical protein